MKFRKKPYIVSAAKFFSSEKPYPEGICNKQHYGIYEQYHVHTGEAVYDIVDGDWITTDEEGKHYVYHPDKFFSLFDRIEEEEEVVNETT